MTSHIRALLKTFFVLNLSLFLSTAYTQDSNDLEPSIETYPQVKIEGTEVREIQSTITGEKYFIHVGLPRSYSDSVESYPALYIMDADGAFGTCTEISRLLTLNKEVPEMIIVGIAYGVSFKEYLFNRQRDYTPTAVDEYAGSGGGEKFFRFIHEELIPFIDTEYRVKKSERAICGFSYGGLFVLYTLFHKPEMFNRYLAGSPSFYWDNSVTFEYEQKYFERSSNLPVRLFMSVGSLENQEAYIQPLNQFTEILNSRGYSGLQLNSIILDDETHYSSFGNAFTKGLKWLFKTYQK
jgi:predicted alpha/beta superfamily hydrolase